MSVYVIADIKVTDPSWIPEYAAAVHDIVHKHGGKYLSRSANVKTTFPSASGSHFARPKKRWNALTCRQPTTPAPAATATPVTVWRPGQCSHPATRWQNTR